MKKQPGWALPNLQEAQKEQQRNHMSSAPFQIPEKLKKNRTGVRNIF